MDILWQYQFRIILLGDSTVGKSSLLKRFTDGIYSDVADPTVGVDFYARSLDIEPGVKIKLQLWDTAGQERFRYNTRQKNKTKKRRSIVGIFTSLLGFIVKSPRGLRVMTR